MTEENEDLGYRSLRDLAYKTYAGRAIIGITAAIVLIGGPLMGIGYLVKNLDENDSVKVQQVIGNDEADVCVDKDGVPFCSHADGKSIKELVEFYHNNK